MMLNIFTKKIDIPQQDFSPNLWRLAIRRLKEDRIAMASLFIVLSFFSVSQAMKVIPIGTAYGVWAGIGAAGTVLCGIIFFGDSYHIVRLISISLIIIGIIGLKLVHVD